jgi:hypothetical protein
MTETIPGTLKGLKNGFFGPQPGTGFFSGHLVENVTPDLNLGGLTVSVAPTSDDFTFNADAISAARPFSNIDLSIFGVEGSFRVISGAFEAVNTTPDLYKSGSVTVYRQDQSWTEANSTLVNGADFTVLESNCPSKVCIPPPQSLAQAKQLNSATWGAEDGCLVPLVIRPYKPHRFLREVPIIPSQIHTSEITDGVFSCFSTSAYLDVNDTIMSSNSRTPGVHFIDAMSSGAYFSGLNENTSILLTGRFIIEKFPDPDSEQVPLARPSPEFDPRALEIIQAAFDNLPVGVKINENAAGDWFRRALGALRSITNSRPFQAALSAAKEAPGNMGIIATAVDAALAIDKARQEKAKKKSSSAMVVKPTAQQQPRTKARPA